MREKRDVISRRRNGLTMRGTIPIVGLKSEPCESPCSRYPRMNEMRDRSRYNGDRSLLRTGSPSLGTATSRPPLSVAICVVQWSALVLTALQSPAFALSASALRQ